MSGGYWQEGNCHISFQKSHPHSWALPASHMCKLLRKATVLQLLYCYLYISNGCCAQYKNMTVVHTCWDVSTLDLYRNSHSAIHGEVLLLCMHCSKVTDVHTFRGLVYALIMAAAVMLCMYTGILLLCVCARIQMFRLMCAYVRTWLLWMYTWMLLLCSHTWFSCIHM